MSDSLHHLLREEAGRIDVPPPPTGVIVTDGRRRSKVRRARRILAAAACAVVVAAGLVAVDRLASDEARGPSPDPTSSPSAPPAPVGGPLDVSGAGVGTQPFGTDADEVVADVTARFGEPDLTVGPQRYARVDGSDAWFEDGDDPLSRSWQYPVTSVACWGELCLMFGGDEVDSLRLRGWEIADHRRWSGGEQTQDLEVPDVRLADTGIRLGDSWKRLHAAYPRTVVSGAEGASVAVQNTPWAGVFDGVAGWRLSGLWDYSRPTHAPVGAVVTRLSGGEGPQPGCC